MNKLYKARTSLRISIIYRLAVCFSFLLVPFLLYSIGTINSLWLSVPFIALAFITLTAYEGIILDFENQRLKVYLNILGWAAGKWQQMPTYHRITAVQTKQKQRLTSNRATQEYEFVKISYEIRLYDTQSHDYQIASKGTKEKVRIDAEKLSQLTHIPVEDFTEPQ